MSTQLPDPIYTTIWGKAYVGDSLDPLPALAAESVDLVITSPPFALQPIFVRFKPKTLAIKPTLF